MQLGLSSLLGRVLQNANISDLDVEKVSGQINKLKASVLGGQSEQHEQPSADTTTKPFSVIRADLENYILFAPPWELSQTAVKQQFKDAVYDPQADPATIRQELEQIDRNYFVEKLLTQQGNLTEEQVNQTVDRVQSAIESIVKAPRRLATRAQKQAAEFGSSLESYLKNTQKEELNPDGIKRDLQLLLKQPGAGLENIGERLGQFDRETLVSLLSQREDISEEEANRIADQVESTYKSIGEQIKKVQETFQSAVDSLFGQVRDYLNALDRPELNYEGLQADFSKVFDDPQAGFEALGERLGQFDRDTRDGVLSQAQRVQQEVKKRYKAIKKQGIETQQIAAGAAWWLFSTALTSLLASAAAGTIAVNGLGFL